MHAHLGEPLDLLGLSMPSEQATWISTSLRDRLDAGGDQCHQPLIGSADGGHDAELGGTGLGGLLGGLDQAGDVQPGAAHRRGEQSGLRAEVAVLRAATGFQADDALDLDLGPAPAHTDLVGQGEKFLEPIVRQLQDLEHLGLGQAFAAFEHLLARRCQHVGALRAACVTRTPPAEDRT